MADAETNAIELADAVRQACVQAAKEAYQEAGFSGLCAEGRWAYAMDAVENLDVSALIPAPVSEPASPDRD